MAIKTNGAARTAKSLNAGVLDRVADVGGIEPEIGECPRSRGQIDPAVRRQLAAAPPKPAHRPRSPASGPFRKSANLREIPTGKPAVRRHGGEIPPDDAVGVVTRTEPPGIDGKCLELQVHRKPAQAAVLAPATVIGPVPVKQGFFNVPSGGVSVAGGLYAFFWTDHCSDPNPLRPSPDDPLARPAPQSKMSRKATIATASARA